MSTGDRRILSINLQNGIPENPSFLKLADFSEVSVGEMLHLSKIDEW